MYNFAHTAKHSHRALVVSAALAFALAGTALSPLRAQAITQETEVELSETQKKVEESAAAYEKATANLGKLQKQIDENSKSIAELEAQLPGQQEKASQALRAGYKSSKGTNLLMKVVLGSDSLEDLLNQMTYLDQITASTSEVLDDLNEAQRQLEQEKAELDRARTEAEKEQGKADEALQEAQKLRQAAQDKAAAEQAAELAALKKAAAEQAAKNAKEKDAAPADTPVETPSVVDTSGINWNVTPEEFVAEWGARIDAYLAGSPLAGMGDTFAKAAWEYGVDPRWSPAISCTESSKGTHCFLPHNAWGWGDVSWPDWESAIYDHVEGLAAIYGYTISVEAAQKYCPPNWYHWYNTTLSEMNRI